MNTETEILNKDLILTVELEDGTTKDCKIITSFVNETTDKKYVVYTPFDEIKDENEDVLLYGALFEEQDGDVILTQVTEKEDMDLLNKVIDDLLKEAEQEEN